MSAKTKSMHQVRQIIELHLKGKSIREIGRLTGTARNTIREYLRRIKQQNNAASQLLTLDDESLSTLLYREEMPVLHGNGRYQFFEQTVNELSKVAFVT